MEWLGGPGGLQQGLASRSAFTNPFGGENSCLWLWQLTAAVNGFAGKTWFPRFAGLLEVEQVDGEAA